MDIGDDEEEIVTRHRKERKELQAEIQKLKKSVSKGDKKKKKDVMDEIAKMEADLNTKQEEEMAAVKTSDKSDEQSEAATVDSDQTPVSVGVADGAEEEDEKEEPNIGGLKKSKAQKRRDKKQAKGKEREQRIQDQAVENRMGPRHLELAAVAKMLKERGLALHEIAADGNCMYNAIGHQLTLRNIESTCGGLREKTASYMKEHSDDFLPFVTHPGTGDMMTPEEFSAYCDKTAKQPVWGGHLELKAMSESLEVPIQVLQADVQPLLIGETKDGPPVTLVYLRHAYRLGEHYNSVSPRTCDEADGEEEGDEPPGET